MALAGGYTNLKHFKSAAQNAKYKSPEIQNELIDCWLELIIEKIAPGKENKYSILGNVANDCAIKEQMALILKFVDRNNIIREEILSVLECQFEDYIRQ